jgi:hypothetical protein
MIGYSNHIRSPKEAEEQAYRCKFLIFCVLIDGETRRRGDAGTRRKISKRRNRLFGLNRPLAKVGYSPENLFSG